MNLVNELNETCCGNLCWDHHYSQNECKDKLLSLEVVNMNAVRSHCREVRCQDSAGRSNKEAIPKTARKREQSVISDSSDKVIAKVCARDQCETCLQFCI